MEKKIEERVEKSSVIIYAPSLLRYFLYIAIMSFAIVFMLFWPLSNRINFLEQAVFIWLVQLAIYFLFPFSRGWLSDKMIILSEGVIAGPPYQAGEHTELQVAEIDPVATNRLSFWQSLAYRTTVYDKQGIQLHIECLYFSPTQLKALYREIGCEYPVLFWHRLEIALLSRY
jgi:hypothetical protein